MLRFALNSFQLVKAGNADAEYEDAVALDAERARFAVADGATESAFAGLWANLVTRGFVDAPPGQPAKDWLSERQTEWRQAVPWDSLPWYGRAKAATGSYCTFLGLGFALSPDEDEIPWRAMAVGDCCLFHVRGLELMRSFPMTQSSDFGNRPRLMGSVPGVCPRLPRGLKGLRGHCLPGDLFVLATDALGQWCLTALEAGEPPWPTLRDLQTQDQFAGWIGFLREQGHLRNDDVTLVVLEPQHELARPF